MFLNSKVFKFYRTEQHNLSPTLLQGQTGWSCTLYSKLKWLTVNQLVSYHTLLAVFKIRNSGEPEYLAQFLKNDNRQSIIIVPNTQLSLAKKSFAWRGSETWNSLPFELRTCTRIGIFKNGAKQWVMNNIQDFID